jgi:hypothetical protein
MDELEEPLLGPESFSRDAIDLVMFKHTCLSLLK